MHPAILTVLRSGGEYRPEHVERLRAQCQRFAPGVPFRCLSDVAVPGVAVSPMRDDWPGWWSKIEAFRVPGPVLYMDLDTTIVGDLAPLLGIAAREPFVVLRDFNWPAREVQSSLMAWAGDMRPLYDNFAAASGQHMSRNAIPRFWGDQGYIERQTPPESRAYWQDLLPGAVVSWKKDCAQSVPSSARVVVFHGRPRPWEVGQ